MIFKDGKYSIELGKSRHLLSFKDLFTVTVSSTKPNDGERFDTVIVGQKKYYIVPLDPSILEDNKLFRIFERLKYWIVRNVEAKNFEL